MVFFVGTVQAKKKKRSFEKTVRQENLYLSELHSKTVSNHADMEMRLEIHVNLCE